MRPTRAAALLTGLAALALTAACATPVPAQDTPELTVLAAASLTDVFEELAPAFEHEHDVQVRFSFGSSTDLAQQAAEGAPGDVLATADRDSMSVARDAGVTDEVGPLAANVLVLVTPPDDPAGVSSLADLEGSTWVRCADEVPCGRVALALLDSAGVTARPASLEEDVRATLDKVTSGEAEAGLVYATDAAAAGEAVRSVEIPEAGRWPATYLIGTLTQSPDAGLARAWVDHVTSDRGRAVLAAAGFRLPVNTR